MLQLENYKENEKKYFGLPRIHFEVDARDCLIINYFEVSTSKIASNDGRITQLQDIYLEGKT